MEKTKNRVKYFDQNIIYLQIKYNRTQNIVKTHTSKSNTQFISGCIKNKGRVGRNKRFVVILKIYRSLKNIVREACGDK